MLTHWRNRDKSSSPQGLVSFAAPAPLLCSACGHTHTWKRPLLCLLPSFHFLCLGFLFGSAVST